MESLNFDQFSVILNEYVLTSEEMIKVRGGGEGEPIVIPNPPRIKI